MRRTRETSPSCYTVEFAGARSEVFAVLARFFRDLRSSNVIALLPRALQGLAGENSSARIDAWFVALHKLRNENLALSASTGFWLDEIEAVLEAARDRLTQLGCEGYAPPRFEVPARVLGAGSRRFEASRSRGV